MHRLRTITKTVLNKQKKNPAKKKQYNDHRVSLKEGNEIAKTMSTAGFKIILNDIQNELAKINESWMDETDQEKIKHLQIKASTWKEVLKKFDLYLLKREIARKALRRKDIDLEPQD